MPAGLVGRRRPLGRAARSPACSPALVPWLLLPPATAADRIGRHGRHGRGGRGARGARRRRRSRPLERAPRRGSSPSSATAATGAPRARWWRAGGSGDPLPAWLFAGAVVAWLAIVPPSARPGRVAAARARRRVARAAVGDRAPARRRGRRRRASARSRRATTACPTASSSGRSWPPASSSCTRASSPASAGSSAAAARRGSSSPRPGVIAVALEPGRQRVRTLVDRLVYGARDDPLAVVQRVVDHLGADSGDDLLPALVDQPPATSCASTPWPSTCAVPTAGSGPPRSGRRRRHRRVVAAAPPRRRRRAPRRRLGATGRRCATGTRRSSTNSSGRSAWPSAGCAWPPICDGRAWPSCRRGRRSGAACAATSTTGSDRR